jgi:hypothetical protein
MVLVLAALMGLCGCASRPPLDNPSLIRPGDSDLENPVLLSPGQPTPEGYAEVYERVLNAIDDYFEIKASSRYAGTIETKPRTAAGYEQFWKPSTPDVQERLKATFQSMRHYCRAKIEAGERGGYRVSIEVYKELEVVLVPLNSPSSTVLIQDSVGISRQPEVILTPRTGDWQWMPAGDAPHRDHAFEQVILRKILRSSALK